MTESGRDGYAAVPTTPRPSSAADQTTPQFLEQPARKAVAWEKPPGQPSSHKSDTCFPNSVVPPKPDYLRLTPVKRRRAKTPVQPAADCSDWYTLLNAKRSSNPGPGDYSPDSAGAKHDFRRPYNAATDGPFFLKDNDESTCVKAMARSLKTPDSGLGPGLYEADSARRKHHVPKVMLGGYAPRDAISKPRGNSYSRSVMAIQTADDQTNGEAVGVDVLTDTHKPAGPNEQASWHVKWMVQRPISSLNHRAYQALPQRVTAKVTPALQVTSAHSRQPAWVQGTFHPPWTCMRRRPGIACALPSDWGWVALGPSNDKGMFVKGAWAGDGRLEVNHRSVLTSKLSSPIRSLTSSSVSNGRRSQESCCIQLGELAAETALQDLTSQQQADSLCYVSPIKDHAEMQLQRLMSPAYAAESMLMAVSDSSQFQKPAAMQNSVRPADWLMTRHCSLPMQR